MGKSSELMQLLKTGNSDAARKFILKLKKSGKKKVLAKELNFPDETGQGQTVMHYCAAQNFVEFLTDLADLGGSIDMIDDRGYTPLHQAALYGRTSAVTALLKKGADPNISAHSGDTPLHYACQNGHTTAVEALVAEHSNCTMLNVSGHTPLDAACQNGHAQIVSVLLKSGQYSQSYLQRSGMPHTALLLAAKAGHNDVIALLITHGFDVNRKLQGYSGNCLHEAILYGKVETTRYLLQCGADIHAPNNQGLGPLEIVQMYTDPRCAGQMKQVLQDSLAQEARVRIAQQHQQQQFAPPQQQQQGSPGVRGHTHPGQPPQQQQYYQQAPPPQPHPLTQPPTPQYQQQQQQQRKPPSPQYQQVGPAAYHSPAPAPPTSSGQASPSSKKISVGSQPAFSYLGGGIGGQSPLKKRSESTGSQHQPPPPQQGYQQQQQQQAYQQQQQQGYQQQQGQQQQQQPTQRTMTMQQQIQQQAAFHQNRSQPIDQVVQEKRLSGNPSDLASMIAAKAASRKPMASSPTRKDFSPHEETLERLSRSSTLSGSGSMDNARQSALRRRNSLTEKKSSPEASEYYDRNPPTLPRRSNIGPPSFKPPPPSEGPPGSHSVLGYQGDTPSPEHTSLPRLRKVVPKAPPAEPSMDSELVKKLQRRQNRIERVDTEEQLQQEAETHPPDDSTGRAPLPPERKTAALSAQLPPPPLSQPPPSSAPQPPPPTTNPPKSGPPPPAPKAKPKPKPKKAVPAVDLPPGVTPWQAEILRKKREQDMQQQLEDDRIAEEERFRREEEERACAEAERVRLEAQQVAEETRLREEEERRRAEEQRKAEEEKRRKTEARRKAAEARRLAEEERQRQEEEMKRVVERRMRMNERKQRELETGVVEVDEEEQQRKREEEDRARAEQERIRAEEGRVRADEERVRAEEEERVRAEERAMEDKVRAMEERVRVEEERFRAEERARAMEEKAMEDKVRAMEERIRVEEEREQARVREAAERQQKMAEERVKESESLTEAVIAPPEEFSGPPEQKQSPPSEKRPDELKLRESGHQMPYHVSTPTSEMSRTSSLSSINTAGTASPGHVTDPVLIADWLASYKLADYTSIFQGAGYDATDFLQALTSDDLVEIGVVKPGHKKKIMAAFSSLRHKEHLIMAKPSSVPAWLDLIGLSQYEQELIDAGYDDIDFISDITSEELEDIGITKKGHLKRFMRGIAELFEVKSSPPTPSALPLAEPPSQQFNGVGVASPPLPPEDTSKTPEPPVETPHPPIKATHPPVKHENSSSNFAKMKSMLAQQMGITTTDGGSEVNEINEFASESPGVQHGVAKAPPPPKRGAQTTPGANRNSFSSSTSSLSSNQSERVQGSHDLRGSVEVPMATQQLLADAIPKAKMVPVATSPSRRSVQLEENGGTLTAAKKSYSLEDITAALDDMIEDNPLLRENASTDYGSREGGGAGQHGSREGGGARQLSVSADKELDALSQALKGFPPAKPKSPSNEEEPDELLAHIDDMLADLNTELDFMIPGTDV